MEKCRFLLQICVPRLFRRIRTVPATSLTNKDIFCWNSVPHEVNDVL
jgi:hypothetical protein